VPDLAEWLIRARVNAGHTQRSLAKATGVNAATIWRVETRQTAPEDVSIGHLLKLSRGLNVSPLEAIAATGVLNTEAADALRLALDISRLSERDRAILAATVEAMKRHA